MKNKIYNIQEYKNKILETYIFISIAKLLTFSQEVLMTFDTKAYSIHSFLEMRMVNITSVIT